ncbi:hypothetical protein Hanom_Chr03g00250501 [Helianthus anomalus]
MILSFAYSRSAMLTALAPSIAALRAATLTKFARSAPENPGVPLAITAKSTSSAFKICWTEFKNSFIRKNDHFVHKKRVNYVVRPCGLLKITITVR